LNGPIGELSGKEPWQSGRTKSGWEKKGGRSGFIKESEDEGQKGRTVFFKGRTREELKEERGTLQRTNRKGLSAKRWKGGDQGPKDQKKRALILP